MSSPDPTFDAHTVRRRLLVAIRRSAGLAGLRTDDLDDWVVAVCDAWAGLAALVGFYEARVMAEAFLATAEQPASIDRLYHSLGHAFPPHATASTAVAYHLSGKTAGVEAVTRAQQAGAGQSAPVRSASPGTTGTPGSTGGPGSAGGLGTPGVPRLAGMPAVPGAPALPVTPTSVPATQPAGLASPVGSGSLGGSGAADSPTVGVTSVVSAGAQIRAIPTAGTTPPTFVTRTAVAAHVGASRLRLAPPPPPGAPNLLASTTQLELGGTRTGLAVGQPLLLQARSVTDQAVHRWVRILSTLSVDRITKTTRVGWDEPLAPEGAGVTDMVDLTVWGFSTSSALVGSTAPAWESLGLARRRGVRSATGRRLAMSGGWALSADHGSTWTSLTAELPSGALPAASRAYGDVLVVADDARLWRRYRGGPLAAAAVSGPRRPLTWLGGQRERMLAAGAAGTVVQSLDDGQTWSPVTGGPPTVQHAPAVAGPSEKATGAAAGRATGGVTTVEPHQLPAVLVRAVVELAGSAGPELAGRPARAPAGQLLPPLLAATDAGLYRHDGLNWTAVRTLDQPVYDVLVDRTGAVHVATAHGVRMLTSKGQWAALGQGLDVRTFVLAEGLDGLLAGCENGLWRCDGSTWTRTWTGGAVSALVVAADGAVQALSDGALLSSRDGGQTWSYASVATPVAVLPDTVLTTSATGPSKPALASSAPSAALVVALADEGIIVGPDASISSATGGYLLSDGDRKFHLERDGTSGPDQADRRSRGQGIDGRSWLVRLESGLGVLGWLDSGTDGILTACGAAPDTVANEWPGSAVAGSTVEIAPARRAVTSGSPAVLEQRTTGTLVSSVLDVSAVAQTSALRFGAQTSLTAISFSGPGLAPGVFPRRASTVWTGASELVVAPQPGPTVDVAEGSTLVLSTSLLTTLEPGRIGTVSGRPIGLAAAPLGGLWSVPVGGRPEPGGPVETSVHQVLADSSGTMLAAADVGVLSVGSAGSEVLADGWPGGPCVTLTQLVDVLVAAGPRGVWGWCDGWPTSGWSRLRSGPCDAVTADADRLLVALAGQVWRCPGADLTSRPPAADPRWSKVGDLLPLPVARLVAGRHGDVLAIAGRQRAVYRLDDDRWLPLAGELDPGGAADITKDPDGAIWAVTPGGIARYDDITRRWSTATAATDLRALATDRLGRVVAVGPTTVHRLESGRWRTVDLVPGIPVTAAAVAPNGTLWLGAAAALELEVGPNRPPALLEHLPVCAGVAVDDRDLATLDQGAVPGGLSDALRTNGHPLGPARVLGTAARGWWLVIGDGQHLVVALRSDRAGRWVDVTAGRTLMHAQGRPITTRDTETWPVSVADGTATLRAPRGCVVALPAGTGTPTVTEIVRLRDGATPAVGSAGTTLTFQAPLQQIYDAATVVVNLNVVDAVQGRPVSVPLGSGDARRTHQSFPVRTPVAAVGGEVARPTRIPASSLQVYVDGQAWREVASFGGCGGQDAAYVVWRNGDGTAIVHFGDGVHGARLPTGRENVVAAYLQGGGPGGATAAGALVQPLDRPQLVTGVHNPVPAVVPPVPAALASRQAAVRCLGSLVSLADFADVAGAQPGVESAWAEVVGGRAVVVTVALRAGGSPSLLGGVAAAVGESSAIGLPVRVVSAAPVPVDVHLEVVGAGTTLAADVFAALAGLDAPRPGAPLTAARVMAAAGSVSGVEGTAILRWARAGAPTPAGSAILARGARWPTDAVSPTGAELVSLDPTAGRLRIDIETPAAGPGDES